MIIFELIAPPLTYTVFQHLTDIVQLIGCVLSSRNRIPREATEKA